jgi:uncharacterized protein (TIGR02246 family)
MNWEAVSAVGQVAASLGVIGSLLYLAAQVKQNNRASTISAKLASTQLLSEFVNDLIKDPELMALWLRGRNDYDALGDRERARFANMCLKAFWFFSTAEFQLRVGTLQEDDWVEFYAVIRYWLKGEGVRTWWERVGRRHFGKNFETFIDEEISYLRVARVQSFAERYTRAWCNEDPNAVAAFFSPDGSLTINGGDPAKGRAAIAAAVRGFMADFPDLTVEMDEIIDRGDDEATYNWTLTGTNTGPGGTGRRVRISGREEWRFGEDGLIADSQGHFDSSEYQRQLEHGALVAVPES